MLLLESEFTLFLGHFHPLVVHLPIGFLLLAGIMEYFAQKPAYAKLNGAIAFTLLLGALSAILSALFGWFLANQGGYEDSTLFWHRWLGIGVAVVSSIAWTIKSEKIKASTQAYRASLGVIVLLLVFTGHLGGNLTHGAGYLLKHAPGFVQNIFGVQKQTVQAMDFSTASPDSVMVYDNLIQPVLQEKCYACHNDSKSNGGLLMTTPEALSEGGDHGAVLVAGNAMESELVKRVTLDQSSKKFMPPKGFPLNYTEIRLLEWWINQGANFENSLAETEVPEDIKTLLLDHYQLSTRKKTFVERTNVSPSSQESIDQLTELGFSINPLAQNTNLLDVSIKDSLSDEQLNALIELKDQITWLNLGNCNITDDMLTTIGQLSNLSRLKLDRNPITAEGLKALEALTNLESINLFATKVGDEAIESLAKMTALESVYLWQSPFSAQAAEQLQSERPDLEINLGMELVQNQSNSEEN